MKETILDVLMFMFQSYVEDNEEVELDKESLHKNLSEAGFADHNIEKAFDYMYPIIECELKKHSLIKYAQDNSPFPFGLNDKTSLVLFFSFESFHFFHKCLQDFSNNGSFSSANIEQLKKSLQKKNM